MHGVVNLDQAEKNLRNVERHQQSAAVVERGDGIAGADAVADVYLGHADEPVERGDDLAVAQRHLRLAQRDRHLFERIAGIEQARSRDRDPLGHPLVT